MSEPANIFCIPAAESGWEIWEHKAGSINLKESVAGNKFPNLKKSTLVCLPVESFLTRVEEVFSADSETEIYGVKMSLEADYPSADSEFDLDAYLLDRQPDMSIYMGLVLESVDAHKTWIDADFSVSAKAYKGGDDLLVWREHGRWVYALYKNNQPVWTDVLGADSLPVQMHGLVSMLEPRLTMLGVDHTPSLIWILDAPEHLELAEVEAAAGIPVQKIQRNQILQGTSAMQMVPAAVRKYRSDRKRTMIQLAALAVIVLLALAGVGVLFNERQKIVAEIADHQEVINKFHPTVEANQLHMEKWDELEPIVSETPPLDVLLECVKNIPGTQQISVELVQISGLEVVLKGQAKDFAAANSFLGALRRDSELQKFTWQGRPNRNKTGFSFTYRGVVKQED